MRWWISETYVYKPKKKEPEAWEIILGLLIVVCAIKGCAAFLV